MKFVVVTGGVVSGLGKGITISSIGRILKSSGMRVTSIKIDPYLNVDAGLMSPFEHGETFVLDDGGETDLDLGNYERFLDITLTAKHNLTSGKAYNEVIQKERRGDFLGKTVQTVPHVTDAIQNWIEQVSHIPVDGSGLEPEVCLIEVGGTVGDIESMVFLEALRQFQFKVGRENTLFIHVSLVPCLGSVGEQKTKPTQHSVKELRSLGLFPDIIVCRSANLLSESTKGKLSSFCQVELKHVLSVHDVSNIYHVPLILVQQNIHHILKNLLGLDTMADTPNLGSWEKIARTVDNFPSKVPIALVGKYNGLSDSYLSVLKSLMHSGIHLNVEVDVQWIDAAALEEITKIEKPEEYDAAWAALKSVAGVVVPGGFGNRGVEGKIAAAKYCRENSKPYLGVCLGMQVMVIEWCRNVMGLTGANSTEFDESTPHPAVVFMPEINPDIMGGTMRLGSRETMVCLAHKDGDVSLGAQVYGLESKGKANEKGSVAERHRHRYEVNPQLVPAIESSGLFFSGKDETGTRMEIAELPTKQHPYFFGVQFHPEFKSRPNRPSPPFFGLVAVATGRASEIHNAGVLWRTGISTRPPTSPRERETSQPIASVPSSPTPYRKRPASAISSGHSSPVPVKASQEHSTGASPSVPVQPAGKCATLAPFKGL